MELGGILEVSTTAALIRVAEELTDCITSLCTIVAGPTGPLANKAPPAVAEPKTISMTAITLSRMCIFEETGRNQILFFDSIA